ncbi:hypothetical protein ABZ153_33850 [Streptomyces sp. NPDC006290]|uniref:hypothetical protein n=1 Tax=Streptomyces sp. NPDC006290 TaxID=3156745 RepID=UPI0033B74865
MSAFSRALAVSAGTPLAILGVWHGWRGLVLAALVTIVAGLGRQVVGAVSRWTLAPAQRQQRWLLKHGHVAGQLTARQLVELTQATHAAELSARAETAPPSATPPCAPRTDTTAP